MITTVIAMLIAVQGQQQDTNSAPQTSAAQIMTKAFAHYSSAQSLSGTVNMAQSAKGVTVTIDSDLQFDRPSKIYLHQTRSGSRARQWLLTSDGSLFSYDKPENNRDFGHTRYTEYVTQHNKAQTIGDMYVASEYSLGDMNPILDVAIADVHRLKRLQDQWVSLAYAGKQNIGGQQVEKITGQYRENARSLASGEFEAYVNGAGDFVRYVLYQKISVPGASNEIIDVTTIWNSSLKVGVQTNPSYYKVVQ